MLLPLFEEIGCDVGNLFHFGDILTHGTLHRRAEDSRKQVGHPNRATMVLWVSAFVPQPEAGKSFMSLQVVEVNEDGEESEDDGRRVAATFRRVPAESPSIW